VDLLAGRDALGYTDIMTLLQITNTGRLNYHLKALGNLVTKDDGGRYRLTEQGRQAASQLKTFPGEGAAREEAVGPEDNSCRGLDPPRDPLHHALRICAPLRLRHHLLLPVRVGLRWHRGAPDGASWFSPHS
jgi:hypothetical protein